MTDYKIEAKRHLLNMIEKLDKKNFNEALSSARYAKSAIDQLPDTKNRELAKFIVDCIIRKKYDPAFKSARQLINSLR